MKVIKIKLEYGCFPVWMYGENNELIINNDWIRYDIQNSVELFFHLKNNKLFRLTTLDNYQGKLFEKIGVGTTGKELLEVEPSFVYNDFEEVWESEKGIITVRQNRKYLLPWGKAEAG